MSLGRTLRLVHYWTSLFTLVTVLVVASTGILLGLKKEFAALQPPTREGSRPGLSPLPIDRLIAGIDGLSWRDVDRIDVRPKDGVAKVILHDRTEVQVDLHSGAVLQTGYRTSDLLEQIHDFSILGDAAKYLLSVPTGVALLVLWGTGAWLFLQPQLAKRRKRRARALGAEAARP